MSSEIAIKVENLSKCYQIYEQPRDRLKQFILPHLQRALGQEPNHYYQEFWALKDVSFEVKKGETVGIIGRNGSGKSTLLQIICGTLNPTGGSFTTNGRIAALLELGSGFNPEFTGRENVYMNAAVLGLSTEEINNRFDEISAFADIGEFINQPVKTYSSGMMVRLAFAVIAHVDADILVIDEALAVGDAVFTQKCMRFIRTFQKNSTLIFVSHDMSSVINMCDRAIWLHAGKIKQVGITKSVTESYLQYTLQEVYGHEIQLKSNKSNDIKICSAVESNVNINNLEDYSNQIVIKNNLHEATGWKTDVGEIISVEFNIINHSEEEMIIFKGGEYVKIIIKAKAYKEIHQPILGFLVRDKLGQDLFGENTLPYTNLQPQSIKAGDIFKAEFTFKLPMLPNGQYAVMTSLADGELHKHLQHHWLNNALILNVSSSKIRYGLMGIEFLNIEFSKI